jgi:hypothetical protein
MHCEDQGVGFVHRSATEVGGTTSQQPQDESGGSGAVGFAGGRAGSDGGSGAVGGPGVSGGSAGATSAGNGAIPGVAGRGSGGAGNGGAGVNAGAGSDGASAGESPVGGAGGQPECGREVTWDGERLVDTDEELAELEGVEVIHGTLVIKKARHLGPLACLRLVDGGHEPPRPGRAGEGGIREDRREPQAHQPGRPRGARERAEPGPQGRRLLTAVQEEVYLDLACSLEGLHNVKSVGTLWLNGSMPSLSGLRGLELVEGDSFRRLFRISNRSSVLSRLAAG